MGQLQLAQFLRQSKNFLPSPLDAALRGPILFGIRGYGPGKKSAGQAVETVKNARIYWFIT
ncbi:hypothetical protein EWM60_00885 [Candidatus Erwinia dacicola]|nr:hypothetical protein [Candidatus Erwinia dacicola]